VSQTAGSRRVTCHFFLTFAFLLLICAGVALAQTTGAGTINGTITDPSGAVVPEANVAIRNTDTGIERKTATSQAGIFSGQFLPPGNYEVEVSKAGFASVLRKNLTLQVGQIVTVELSLAVQSTQQEVTVSTAAPLVDTEKTDVSQTVTTAAMENLPVNGRRWDTFALMMPNTTNDGTNGMVSYRGVSGLYNGNTVDGANNNQAFFSEARGRANSGVYVYSLDSIMEYQVTASNYSAELGQAAGGIINAVTKSGTNAFHADLFYYLRYPSWNALDSYPKSEGIYSQPIHQWQQFGGSFGGPIIKDKLFYFATYDGSRKVNPISYTSSTYNATVKALPCPVQVTTTQCANANAFIDGLFGTFPRATDEDVLFGKLDYQVTDRNHISSSFDWMDSSAPNAYSTTPSVNNSSIYTNGSYIFHERIFVTNWDSIISNNLVNKVRFQWGRDLETAGSNAPAPYVSLSNITAFGENYALPRVAEPDEHRIQLSDTLSWVHGAHTVKAGFDINIIHEVMINLFYGTGYYSYTGAAQTAFNNWVLDAYGINIGDGLTGKHYNTFLDATDVKTGTGKDDFYDNDYAGFVEDSWKATPHLTVNLGLRYDIFTVPGPPVPNTTTYLSTYYNDKINVPKNQWQPRAGVAWEINPKTVVRTGYGIFYGKTTNSTYYATRVENGIYQQEYTCTPSPTSSTYCPALTYPNIIFPAPGPALAPAFAGSLAPQLTPFAPPAGALSGRGLTPNWENPMAQEGDVAVERQLPGGLAASIAYVVSRGEHLPIFLDENLAPATTTKSYDILNTSGQTVQTYTVPFYTSRITPQIGDIYVGQSVVNSWYNSMVLTFRRPMNHGVEFAVNYTLSRATDGAQVDGSSGTFSGTDIPLNPYNLKGEYGLSDLNQTHRFVGNVVWMPQLQHLSNKAARWILNGWALSAIATEASGQPVTAYISGTPSPLDGGLTGGEASNGNPTAGRAGWLPRNSFTGPSFHDVDFRLGRQFTITEKLKLSLMGEAYNLFNTTNILSVNTTAFTYTAAGSGACAGHANGCLIPSPTFMTPSLSSSFTAGPRQLQISGRLTF